jgi:hypothetical protein
MSAQKWSLLASWQCLGEGKGSWELPVSKVHLFTSQKLPITVLFLFIILVLEFELQVLRAGTLPFEALLQSCFVLGIFEIGSQELFSGGAALKLRSS